MGRLIVCISLWDRRVSRDLSASTVTLGPWVNLNIGAGALPVVSQHLAAGFRWKSAEGKGDTGYQVNSVALGDGYMVKILNR